jgi:cell division protein FtsB
MRDFAKHTGPRRQKLRLLAGVVGIIVLGFITFEAAHAAWGMYGKFAEAAGDNATAEQNLSQLTAEEAQMSAEVVALSSERGQEAALRQTYGVALPGEGEIQIIEESPSSTPPQPQQQNFFARLWHALFP